MSSFRRFCILLHARCDCVPDVQLFLELQGSKIIVRNCLCHSAAAGPVHLVDVAAFVALYIAHFDMLANDPGSL